MPRKKNTVQKLDVLSCYDEFAAVSSRLELLSVLLASNGDNLPPIFSNRDDWQHEVRMLVSDELVRLAVHIRSLES